MARTPEFDLAKALATPSFTPGRRDAEPLVELIVKGTEPAATRAAPALAQLGDVAHAAITQRWSGELDDAARARFVAVLGLLARDASAAARTTLIGHVGDAATRVRRAAIVALGKLGAPRTGAATSDEEVRAVLLARWDAGDVPVDERRALAEALGKLGGDHVLARLRALDVTGDAELARRRDRAVLVADRDARREEPSEIATDLAPPRPLIVRLGCRAGLGSLLAEEAQACGFAPSHVTDRDLEVTLAGPWSALFAMRLWVTAGIRIPIAGSSTTPDALAAAIVQALVAAPTRALLASWTRGAIRWRLGFAHGHKRAIVWRVARDVTRAAPELINDPTATTWDVFIDDDARMLELVPRRAVDPRFAWRVAEVPAASHPTVAAALARVAGVRAGDRVWDPFCGSAGELVERARLGPVRELIGSDLDEAALAAARQNLDAAGVTARLASSDARVYSPAMVDLVITNPPLGSRVQVDAAALLEDCLPNFERQLAPGGRLVWITPAPRRTTPVAEALGLRRSVQLPVDLGGVRGHLERWDKPATAG